MATKINKFIFFIYLRVVENGDAKKDCIVCFWVYLFYFYILIVLWPCETHSMLLFFISVFFFRLFIFAKVFTGCIGWLPQCPDMCATESSDARREIFPTTGNSDSDFFWTFIWILWQLSWTKIKRESTAYRCCPDVQLPAHHQWIHEMVIKHAVLMKKKHSNQLNCVGWFNCKKKLEWFAVRTMLLY